MKQISDIREIEVVRGCRGAKIVYTDGSSLIDDSIFVTVVVPPEEPSPRLDRFNRKPRISDHIL